MSYVLFLFKLLQFSTQIAKRIYLKHQVFHHLKPKKTKKHQLPPPHPFFLVVCKSLCLSSRDKVSVSFASAFFQDRCTRGELLFRLRAERGDAAAEGELRLLLGLVRCQGARDQGLGTMEIVGKNQPTTMPMTTLDTTY